MVGWRVVRAGSLLLLLVLGQVGCAVRGGLVDRGGPGTPSPERPTGEVVSVVSGEGRTRVKRDGFAETWGQETRRCMGDTALTVGVQTFGVGLLVLPPVCAVMTAALPGMTTQFQARRMRRAVEDSLQAADLHARLRDGFALAARESGRPAPALADAPPDASGPTAGAGAALRPEAILEVTVTEVGIRDDATLSSVSARARVLRASDRAELASRVFTQQAVAREHWHAALEPALAALAAAIAEAMVTAPRAGPAGSQEPVAETAINGKGDEP
jgi:hypothetical protein